MIYIDNARHLPNGVSATKIVIRIVNEQGDILFPIYEKMCSVNDLIYFPKFHYRFSIFGNKLASGLVFMHVLFLTVEDQKIKKTKVKTSILGFSIFNIFVTEEGNCVTPVENVIVDNEKEKSNKDDKEKSNKDDKEKSNKDDKEKSNKDAEDQEDKKENESKGELSGD